MSSLHLQAMPIYGASIQYITLNVWVIDSLVTDKVIYKREYSKTSWVHTPLSHCHISEFSKN
jgi:hypothetical protein